MIIIVKFATKNLKIYIEIVRYLIYFADIAKVFKWPIIYYSKKSEYLVGLYLTYEMKLIDLIVRRWNIEDMIKSRFLGK